MEKELFKNITEFRRGNNIYPDKNKVHEFISSLFDFLFIREMNEEQFIRQLYALKGEFVQITVCSSGIVNKDPVDISDDFFVELVTITNLCKKDAEAILRFDPAARSINEVINIYPGFLAIAMFRIAHVMWKLGMNYTARIVSEWVHSVTGIDIHPAASIGNSFAIDHGTGIVIGETTVIGNNVKLYQGVTLGALQVAKKLQGIKRHPTIEDNVVIYANATILGGETVIGAGSIIGGNVWLTKSISPCSMVYHRKEVIVKEREFKTN